jgi:hypothetical protein
LRRPMLASDDDRLLALVNDRRTIHADVRVQYQQLSLQIGRLTHAWTAQLGSVSGGNAVPQFPLSRTRSPASAVARA